MTILGAFFFASLVLTSCGGPKSDAKKVAKCFCDAQELAKEMMENPDDKDLVKKSEKLEKKCEKLDKLDEKYGTPFEPKDDDKSKKFWEALEEAMKDCE